MSDYYTYSEIVAKANSIKKGVVKEYKIVENPQWVYWICRAILTPKKNIPKFKVNPAPKQTGDNLNRQIIEKDYKDMASRLIKFVDKNKTLPNYIIVNSKKMKMQDYVYMFSRILVYYFNNGVYPKYANVNSTSFTKPAGNKKYGHATKPGCDNMGQNNSVNCGPHSLQEVFRNLTGIVVPQSTIASWAGTTSGGSSHKGLETAVSQFNKKYNQKLTVTWKNFSDLGWTGINKILTSKNQDCIIHNLYRNQYGHYEVINSISGSDVRVQNSLGSKCGSCYCGYVETRSQSIFRSYINGISQKSVMVITNAK